MTTTSLGTDSTNPPPGPAGASGEPAIPRLGLGLGPLRAALLARARSTAADLVGAARDERDRVLAEAEREAADLVDGARAQGHTDGEELLASDRAVARAADRARLLAAQREAYESLRATCRLRVHDLLAEPGARERLVAVALGSLGAGAADAAVEPTPDGGVAVRAPDGRRVDASVSALVDAALAEHDLALLWSPR